MSAPTPAAVVAAIPPVEYVSVTAAIRRTGIGRLRVQSLAMSGRVRVESIPGQLVRVCLDDLAALAPAERGLRGRPRLARPALQPQA